MAAILRATWPLLPMPVTTTRPGAAASVATARARSAPSEPASAVSASASAVSTRRAAAISAASAEGSGEVAALPLVSGSRTAMVMDWGHLQACKIRSTRKAAAQTIRNHAGIERQKRENR